MSNLKNLHSAPGQLFQTPDGRIFTTSVINETNEEDTNEAPAIEEVRDAPEAVEVQEPEEVSEEVEEEEAIERTPVPQEQPEVCDQLILMNNDSHFLIDC